MGSSSGLILADQTGIGKGRTVASIIRWAVLQGRTAIFVTQKETLFVDMMRDLQAIDFAKNPIFVINTNIIKVNGKDISSNKNKDNYKGEKIVFTTYTQFQDAKASWKKQRLMQISKGAILVLDEAHEGAASVNPISDRRGAKDKESNRYKFLSSLFANIEGVLFSSATYAKRPDNLMLYYPFTDLNNFKYNDLLLMLKKTGPIGQALVSNALVETGQLIRRESSYKGITFNDYTTPDLISISTNRKTDAQDEYQNIAQAWDKMSEIFKDLVVFERAYKKEILELVNNEIKGAGNTIAGADSMQADSSNFTSRMHNTVKQLDLSLKAKSIVEYASKLVQDGQKVLIYLHFTNVAFFTENFEMGEKVEDDIGLVLLKNWSKILEYSVKVGKKRIKHSLKISELNLIEGAYEHYIQIHEKIKKLNFSVPLSAIDYFHYEFGKRGYKVLEVTGRNVKVDYSKGKILANRTKDKTDFVSNLFNNTSDHNILIFNSSGATGISLHSSKDFKNQNKRHMIVAQPSDDINTYMQAFGRINRTGQTVLPEYTFVSIPIPVSNRIRIVLRKKLASLNANVKGSSKDETSMKDIIDMANEHGDQVVFNYLSSFESSNDEVYKLNVMLDDPCGLFKEEGTTKANAFLKTTGRLPILSIKEQENFYDQVTDRYIGYMEDLKRMGVTLEESALDLQARTVSKKEILPASGKNIFQQACYIETVEIKTEHPDLNEIYDTLDYDRVDKVRREYETALSEYKKLKQENAQLTNTSFEFSEEQEKFIEQFETFMNRFKIGTFHMWKSLTNADVEYLLVKDIRYSPRKNTFPCSLSYLKIDFISTANITGEVYQTLILSQVNLLNEISKMNVNKNDILKSMQSQIDNINNVRQIITGNLIYGLTKVGNAGKYCTYTTHDGATKTGILIPVRKNISIKQYSISDIVHKIVRLNKSVVFQQVELFKDENDLTVSVPRSRKSGGKFFLDQELISLTIDKQGFISRNENSNFLGRFLLDKTELILRRLEKLGIVFEEIEVTKENS